MRVAYLILLGIHTIIHLLWFAHAFGWVELEYFSKEIPGTVGFSWLLTALIFLWSAIALGRKRPLWFLPAVLGILLSQLWIFSAWEDTKFGSLANLLLLPGILVGYARWEFENRFRDDASQVFHILSSTDGILEESALEDLPDLVAGYIRKSGAVGKPRIRNFHLEFEGEMREKGKAWFPFTSEQYSFIPVPARLFFMKARIKGVSVWGYHSYRPKLAKMLIKLLSLIPVVRVETPELYPTETVTFFNDLCLFAPGALADPRIRWEPLDQSSVMGTFTLGELTISAQLYFDAEGRLVNFRSEDRWAVSDMRRLPFTTPVGPYRNYDGYMLPSGGEAIWHYPDGEFTYGKFRLKSIAYNLEGLLPPAR